MAERLSAERRVAPSGIKEPLHHTTGARHCFKVRKQARQASHTAARLYRSAVVTVGLASRKPAPQVSANQSTHSFCVTADLFSQAFVPNAPTGAKCFFHSSPEKTLEALNPLHRCSSPHSRGTSGGRAHSCTDRVMILHSRLPSAHVMRLRSARAMSGPPAPCALPIMVIRPLLQAPQEYTEDGKKMFLLPFCD